jgi:hypothetical protein
VVDRSKFKDTKFKIKMICEEDELKKLIEQYGKECYKCKNIYFTLEEIDPDDTSPLILKHA